MSIIKGKTNVVAGFGGTKRPLGEVYFSQSSLATDNPGALPGWTGEYYENGKTLFPDLYNFVKAHSELQVTKEQYDNAIAIYGECPKYVVDENAAQTSLRLPKYANYIKMANSTEGITQKGAGLPNITCPLYTEGGAENNHLAAGGNSAGGKTWSASAFNPIYGVADTVQPAHTTLYPWISAYTSAIPTSTAQAAEFTNALTGKANTDLSNVPTNIDYVVESKVPTASDPSWYRKYKSGWLEQGGQTPTVAGGATTTVTLLKPYNNTVYNVMVQPVGAYTNSGEANNIIPTRTTTNFVIASGQIAAQPFIWRAEGQGA